MERERGRTTNAYGTFSINFDKEAPYMESQFLAEPGQVCIFRPEPQWESRPKRVDTLHHENLIHSAEFL